MKRLLGLTIILLLSAGGVRAQNGNTVTRTSSGAPSSLNCNYNLFVNDVTNGNIYFCSNGTLTLLNGGGFPVTTSVHVTTGTLTIDSGGTFVFAAGSTSSGNFGGNAATATDLASYTSYSVFGAGNGVKAWLTPTANSQCLMSGSSNYATTTPSFQTCAAGASITVNGGSALSSPVNFETGPNVTVSNPSGSNVQFTLAPSDLGAVAWNNGGNCTFAAASAAIAGGTLTTVSTQSCTLVVTGAAKWGDYTLDITNAASTAATLTLGACGSGVFKGVNGANGAVTLSGAGLQDIIHWKYNGTDCIFDFGPNAN